MSARTGCGICGIDSLTDVVRSQDKIEFEFILEESAIDRALKESLPLQVLNQKTGGLTLLFLFQVRGRS